jgi:opacity protein-like surface antigen
MVKRSPVVVAALFVWLAAVPARAQGYVTPFVGSPINTGGSSGTTWGAAAGGMSSGVIGGELEFANSPHFFSEGPSPHSVLTLQGNMLLGIPMGAFRPYGTAGVGLIRQHRTLSFNGVFADVTDNDFGYNFGAGAHFRMSDGFGIRTDWRRFQVRKAGGFSFDRFFVGVVLGNAG